MPGRAHQNDQGPADKDRPLLTRRRALAAGLGAAVLGLGAAALRFAHGYDAPEQEPADETRPVVEDAPAGDAGVDDAGAADSGAADAPAEPEAQQTPSSEELFSALDLTQDLHDEFDHGPKPVEYQRYIVLHDTEGSGAPEGVVSWWASNGKLVAAHFVVGKDGHIVQCVPLESIAHHAGFGDTGHNELFGISDDGRDDRLGTVSIGSAFADYGMNAWSVGIELVHVGGEGDYPAEQLQALDGLIAYIDAYFAELGQAEPSAITDHKAWRSGNSDTSPEFAGYLANYQLRRTYM